MELPSQEENEMPIPLNSTYVGAGHGHAHGPPLGHMIHHHYQDHHPTPHNHIIPQLPSNGPPTSSAATTTTTITTTIDENHAVPFKKVVVKYKECLKNHAASMGGNATDGCGEFMPSGEEGTLEALTCSACNCHRNFHRKVVEGDPNMPSYDNCCPRMGRKLFIGHHQHHHKGSYLGPEYPSGTGTLISSRPVAPHQMIMSYNMGGSLPSESDEQEEGGGDGVGGAVVRPPQLVKKRFRTKFTQEQKEKMLSFAEKVGWKIQKQEEAVVQQFCQEVGVKRRVLKVWMHNNKHNFAKKVHQPDTSQNQVQ